MTQEEPLLSQPKTLGDWRRVAEQYESVVARWLSGQLRDSAVTCFNHAAGLRYGPSKNVLACSGSAKHANASAELYARLSEVYCHVWLIAQIIEKTRTRPVGGDDASATRRYTFQTCLTPPSRRIGVLPQLNEVNVTSGLDL